MQSDKRFVKYSTAAIAILALGGGIATACVLLGAPAGAIVLSEVCGFACVTTFTLLIWGAILDGKQPDRVDAGESLAVNLAPDRVKVARRATRAYSTGRTMTVGTLGADVPVALDEREVRRYDLSAGLSHG